MASTSMNQSILFNDDFSWDSDNLNVRFTAQHNGAIITCLLSPSYLKAIGFNEGTAKNAVAFCELMQFDIEEDAQQAINDERLDENNQLKLD